MYGILLHIHSLVRWLVVAGLVIGLVPVYAALLRPRPFTGGDRRRISLAASAAHLQLLLGLTLYIVSPFTAYFRAHLSESLANTQLLFFGAIHIAGMIAAVVVMTIGSSLARRAEDDRRKFRMVAIYWTAAILLILMLVPWPWSPLAQRPLWRPF